MAGLGDLAAQPWLDYFLTTHHFKDGYKASHL